MNSFLKREGGLRKHGRFSEESQSEEPLVTIVTVVRNGVETIEQTIRSVLGQTYTNIEYIVIDGCSTDGTLDIIKKYEENIAYWISEPDNGISDAFNKGIARATGEFVALINADDWMSSDQVEQAVNVLKQHSADFVFGDLIYHNEDGGENHRIKGDPEYKKAINSKMPALCHPSVMARRSAYQRAGLFDPRYRYAMDYEWFLRLHRTGGRGIYSMNITAHMRLAGISDRSYLKSLKEVRNIAVQYGQPAWIANFLFAFRIMKSFSRRWLEKLLPRGMYDRIRGLMNRSYCSQINNHKGIMR